MRKTALLLFTTLVFLQGATKKGDELIARARAAEDKGTTASLDEALALAVEALKLDPSDTEYVLTEARIRALAGQKHVRNGDTLLRQRRFQEAQVEFEKASEIDTAPSVGRDYAKRVRQIIEQLSKNPGLDPGQAMLSPLQRAEQQAEELFSRMKPPARLDVRLAQPLPQFRVNNQLSAEVFVLLGKLANLRVLFDPEYQSRGLGRNQFLDFRGLTLEEALDQVALITKSFWKPVNRDTILVSNDDAEKRGQFDDEVTKVLYLSNSPTPQETQRVGETVKNVTDLKKLLIHPDQNALVLRGDANRVTLAQKIVEDLDKPKAEIIIDVLVLSVSKDWTRELGTSFALTNGNLSAKLTPRASIGGGSGGGTATIPLNALPRLQAGDFALTLPSAAVNALLSTQTTKIVDKAQLRTVEGQRSSLRIGQRVPYATGSFAPGASNGLSALVNTQFSFFDVGLNIDVVAKVHEPDEVSLHIESDHSSVSEYQNIGGLVQPVITQRKRVADVRVKEGEANFWDIVTERQTTKAITGIPGLNKIPVLGQLLTQTHRAESENLLLHLLIPHIIRSSDIRESNVGAVASGNERVVRLSYAPGEDAVRSEPTERVVDVVETMPEPVVKRDPPRQEAAPVAVPAAAVIQMKPATASVIAGRELIIELEAAGLADMASAEFLIDFDAGVLKCTGVTAGTYMDGAPVLKHNIQDGNLSFSLTKPAGSGPNGDAAKRAPLVTLRFEAVKPGASAVSVSLSSLKNGRGQALEANIAPAQVEVK